MESYGASWEAAEAAAAEDISLESTITNITSISGGFSVEGTVVIKSGEFDLSEYSTTMIDPIVCVNIKIGLMATGNSDADKYINNVEKATLSCIGPIKFSYSGEESNSTPSTTSGISGTGTTADGIVNIIYAGFVNINAFKLQSGYSFVFNMDLKNTVSAYATNKPKRLTVSVVDFNIFRKLYSIDTYTLIDPDKPLLSYSNMTAKGTLDTLTDISNASSDIYLKSLVISVYTDVNEIEIPAKLHVAGNIYIEFHNLYTGTTTYVKRDMKARALDYNTTDDAILRLPADHMMDLIQHRYSKYLELFRHVIVNMPIVEVPQTGSPLADVPKTYLDRSTGTLDNLDLLEYFGTINLLDSSVRIMKDNNSTVSSGIANYTDINYPFYSSTNISDTGYPSSTPTDTPQAARIRIGYVMMINNSSSAYTGAHIFACANKLRFRTFSSTFGLDSVNKNTTLSKSSAARTAYTDASDNSETYQLDLSIPHNEAVIVPVYAVTFEYNANNNYTFIFPIGTNDTIIQLTVDQKEAFLKDAGMLGNITRLHNDYTTLNARIPNLMRDYTTATGVSKLSNFKTPLKYKTASFVPDGTGNLEMMSIKYTPGTYSLKYDSTNDWFQWLRSGAYSVVSYTRDEILDIGNGAAEESGMLTTYSNNHDATYGASLTMPTYGTDGSNTLAFSPINTTNDLSVSGFLPNFSIKGSVGGIVLGSNDTSQTIYSRSKKLTIGSSGQGAQLGSAIRTSSTMGTYALAYAEVRVHSNSTINGDNPIEILPLVHNTPSKFQCDSNSTITAPIVGNVTETVIARSTIKYYYNRFRGIVDSTNKFVEPSSTSITYSATDSTFTNCTVIYEAPEKPNASTTLTHTITNCTLENLTWGILNRTKEYASSSTNSLVGGKVTGDLNFVKHGVGNYTIGAPSKAVSIGKLILPEHYTGDVQINGTTTIATLDDKRADIVLSNGIVDRPIMVNDNTKLTVTTLESDWDQYPIRTTNTSFSNLSDIPKIKIITANVRHTGNITYNYGPYIEHANIQNFVIHGSVGTTTTTFKDYAKMLLKNSTISLMKLANVTIAASDPMNITVNDDVTVSGSTYVSSTNRPKTTLRLESTEDLTSDIAIKITEETSLAAHQNTFNFTGTNVKISYVKVHPGNTTTPVSQGSATYTSTRIINGAASHS